MIKSFDHKGLKLLYEKGDESRVKPEHVRKIKKALTWLSVAKTLKDTYMASPGLHPLKGNFAGHHAVWISGNWRITFRFENGDVYNVNYIDYH